MLDNLAQLSGHINIHNLAVDYGVEVDNTFSRLQFATTYALQNKRAVFLSLGEDKEGIQYRVYDESPASQGFHSLNKNLAVILPNGSEERYMLEDYTAEDLLELAGEVKTACNLKEDPAMFFCQTNVEGHVLVRPIQILEC